MDFSFAVLNIQIFVFSVFLQVALVTANCYKFLSTGVLFLFRSPDDSRIRSKTIYAVSRNQFRHELDGVHFEIQATDPDDMDLDVLRGRANRT
jgi:hypothetical protein